MQEAIIRTSIKHNGIIFILYQQAKSRFNPQQTFYTWG